MACKNQLCEIIIIILIIITHTMGIIVLAIVLTV